MCAACFDAISARLDAPRRSAYVPPPQEQRLTREEIAAQQEAQRVNRLAAEDVLTKLDAATVAAATPTTTDGRRVGSRREIAATDPVIGPVQILFVVCRQPAIDAGPRKRELCWHAQRARRDVHSAETWTGTNYQASAAWVASNVTTFRRHQ